MTQEITEEKVNLRVFLKTNSFGLLAILGANLVFFGPFLFSFEAISIGSKAGDLPFLFKPIREFATAQLANGIFPFWEPFSMSGRPFFADPQTELLNPFSYLFLLMPSHLAFSWVYFLHFLIGGFGFFYFARRLKISVLGSILGALIYLFSSPHVLHLYAGHYVIITTMAWTPWVLWATEGFLSKPSWKWAGVFGLILAMHLYGGFAQYTYGLGWVVFAYLIWAIVKGRLKGYFFKSSFQLGCATLLGLGVFFIQVHSTWELTQNSIREGGDFNFTSSYSLSPENLITLIAPKFFGEQVELESGNKFYFGQSLVWENLCYFGVISLSLFMAMCGRKTSSDQKFWIFIFLLSIILALGKATPLFKWCFDFVPGFSLFRGYSKTLTFGCLALAILAGMQLDHIMSASRLGLDRYFYLITPLLLTVLFILSELSLDSLPFWKDELFSKVNGLGLIKFINGIEIGFSEELRINLLISLFLSFSLVFVFFTIDKSRLANWKGEMICALAFLDFFLFANSYFQSVDFKKFDLPEKFVEISQAERERHRVFTSDWRVSNSGYAQGLSTNAGYQTFVLKSMKRFSGFFKGELLKRKGSYITSPLTREGLKLFGVQSILGPKIMQSPIPFETTANENYLGVSFYLYKLEKSQSKYSLSRQLEPATPGEESNNEFSERYKGLVQQLYQEFPDKTFVSPDDYKKLKSYLNSGVAKEGNGTIEVLHEGINKIRLRVETELPALLVVNENYYPGWRCLIDDQEVEVFSANLIMKTVGVPAGSHIIEFYFLPTHFHRNALISGASLFMLMLMVFPYPRRLSGGSRRFEKSVT